MTLWDYLYKVGHNDPTVFFVVLIIIGGSLCGISKNIANACGKGGDDDENN